VRWFFVLVVCAGCYAPDPQPGAPCANGFCPHGLTCSPATNTCERFAIDAAVPSDTVDAPNPPDAVTLPMMLQHATNYAASATTLSVTLPATPVTDHVLIMIGAHLSGSIQTVTGGATWKLAARSVINSNVEIWYGVSDGSNATVTIARPPESAPMWIAVSEWSGLATTNSLDAARAENGTGNPVSAASITTTNARDLLLFAATTAAPNTYATPTPGTWTAMPAISSPTFVQGEWYRIVTTPGAYAPQVTQTGADGWEAAVAALRIAP
jgi:hypothetical protein